MKVIWPCPWFGDYRVPVFEELNNLFEYNFKVFYSKQDVTQSVDSKMIKRLGNSTEGLIGKTIRIGDHSSDFANKDLIIRYQPGLYKKIKDFNPDIIIVEAFGGWSMIGILYGILHRKKIMLFYERTAYVERNSPWWRTLYRKIIGKAIDAFLINGQLTREYLENGLGLKKQPKTEGLMVADSKGLENAVNSFPNEEKNELKKSLQLNSGLTYLFVGQIVERKGITQLLEAWEEHIQQHTEDNLLVIGTGILLEKLQHKYRGVQSIHLLGRIEYDEVYKYYAIANVFVMPTLEDNWCLVVPEAMACKLPIACSIYNGGHLELIEEGKNGYRFDPLKKESIIQTLSLFHHSNLNKMGNTSYFIVQNYTPEIAARKIYNACLSLYNQY